MHDTRCLGLVHWDDPERWYGEGGGRRVQDGEHMYAAKGEGPGPSGQRSLVSCTRALGLEDSLETVATHSSILAWRIP